MGGIGPTNSCLHGFGGLAVGTPPIEQLTHEIAEVWAKVVVVVNPLATAKGTSRHAHAFDLLHDRIERRDFILDGKLPGKLAAGEKDLQVLLLPRLGSNPYELVVPTTWYEEPTHPFIEKFSTGEGKLSLNGIFEHGLRFESSHDHAGLQLVDTVAYVIRKAILEPDNELIHRAYGEIRENLRTERDGQALRLVRYEGGEESVEDARYRLVL